MGAKVRAGVRCEKDREVIPSHGKPSRSKEAHWAAPPKNAGGHFTSKPQDTVALNSESNTAVAAHRTDGASKGNCLDACDSTRAEKSCGQTRTAAGTACSRQPHRDPLDGTAFFGESSTLGRQPSCKETTSAKHCLSQEMCKPGRCVRENFAAEGRDVTPAQRGQPGRPQCKSMHAASVCSTSHSKKQDTCSREQCYVDPNPQDHKDERLQIDDSGGSDLDPYHALFCSANFCRTWSPQRLAALDVCGEGCSDPSRITKKDKESNGGKAAWRPAGHAPTSSLPSGMTSKGTAFPGLCLSSGLTGRMRLPPRSRSATPRRQGSAPQRPQLEEIVRQMAEALLASTGQENGTVCILDLEPVFEETPWCTFFHWLIDQGGADATTRFDRATLEHLLRRYIEDGVRSGRARSCHRGRSGSPRMKSIGERQRDGVLVDGQNHNKHRLRQGSFVVWRSSLVDCPEALEEPRRFDSVPADDPSGLPHRSGNSNRKFFGGGALTHSSKHGENVDEASPREAMQPGRRFECRSPRDGARDSLVNTTAASAAKFRVGGDVFFETVPVCVRRDAWTQEPIPIPSPETSCYRSGCPKSSSPRSDSPRSSSPSRTQEAVESPGRRKASLSPSLHGDGYPSQWTNDSEGPCDGIWAVSSDGYGTLDVCGRTCLQQCLQQQQQQRTQQQQRQQGQQNESHLLEWPAWKAVPSGCHPQAVCGGALGWELRHRPSPLRQSGGEDIPWNCQYEGPVNKGLPRATVC